MTVAGNPAASNNPLSGLRNALGNLLGGNNQTQTQTQTNQSTPVDNAEFSTNDDTGLQIRNVYPPITPDKLIGVYDTPVPTLSLPNLKLDKVTPSNVKNKNLTGYLKAIEQKISATEKLMKDIVKLQNLQILTEKEVSERKRELYQNTFEEYLLDKTVDFRDKKKKGCTCINLPDKAPSSPPIVAPGFNPTAQGAPATVPDTSTQAQPSTSPTTAPSPSPAPSPIFDPKGWNEPQFSPNTPPAPRQSPLPQLPPWLKLPPPIPRLPDLEGLGGLASEKLNEYGQLFGINGTSLASVVKQLKPIAEKLKQPITEENKKILYDNALAIAESAGMTAQQAMMLVTAFLGTAVAVGGAVTGLDNMIPNNASGAIVPYAKGGIPGGDLELYSSESQSYFRTMSNDITNKIASDIPLGPHTPLPHPGYVKPQGGHIPRPNLRGMPGPTGKTMPWGWQPTLLAKGAIVNAADGKMFGPSWMPWNWGKLVDDQRKNNKLIGAEGRYSNVTDPEMRRMLGLPPKAYSSGGIVSESDNKKMMDLINSGGLKSNPQILNELNPFTHILRLSNKVRSKLVPAPKAQKPKMPSLPSSARQVTQYPEGVSTGVGGGNAGSYVPERTRTRQSARPISRPTAKPVENMDPYAKQNEEYRNLIAQGKIKEAEELGMKIWREKYSNTSMVKPESVAPVSSNTTTNLERSQSQLTSNSTTKQNIIPLDPNYIKIPGRKTQSQEKNNDTLMPPPGISDRLSGPFRRDTGYFE